MQKKIVALAMALLFLSGAMAQSVRVEKSDFSQAEYIFEASAPQYSSMAVEGKKYAVINLEGSSPSTQIGQPNLPLVSEFVEIPLCDNVKVLVSDVKFETVNKLDDMLIPVQPAPSKADKSARPFVMDSAVYAKDAFYSHELAWVEQMGVARDRNVAILRLSPFSYNPVTGELRMVTSMKVTLAYENADVAATMQMRSRYYSPDFSVGHKLLSTLPGTKSVAQSAPLHYLIVADAMFRGSLDEFVAWKKRQGFLVTVAYTDESNVGTTSASIAAYIKSFYTNASSELPAPTFLLLVGDQQQIPAFNARCSYPDNDHVTDLYFASWTDGDNIPDCYYGRFSARSIAELTPQIEKTIFYESYDFTNDSYLRRAVLIAGEDQGYTGDNAYNYADPAMDYIAKTYVNAANGYSDVKYYKNNTTFAPAGVTVTGSSLTSATAATLRNLYNTGIGWVNYSAHGYDDEWSTPSFNTRNAAAMTNYGMPSIMIGNCCLSGKFNTTYSDKCLGEALLQRERNAGAVAYFGGTNSTYWPHDFCWSVGVRSNIANTMDANYVPGYLGMYDRLFHTHSENHSAWHISAGAMTMAGNMAVEQYGSYAQYYWEIYELFGDPSLMPWLSTAEEMDVVAPDIEFGSTTYSVIAAPYAYVALTTQDEHELITAAYADGDGNAVLAIPSDLMPGDYELAIWAQNYKPYFQDVAVLVMDGFSPLGAILSMEPTSPLRPGQCVSFDITFTNMGHGEPSVGLITLTSETDGILCVQPEAHFGSLHPGDTVTLHDAFMAYIPRSFANKDKVKFCATIDVGSTPTSRKKTFQVSAAHLVAADKSISSTLLPDSSVTISCRVVNNGGDTASGYLFSLVNNWGLLAQGAPAVPVAAIAPEESAMLSFPITMASSLPDGNIHFYLCATKEGETCNIDTLVFRVGDAGIVNFEDGTIPASWNPNGNPWEITTSNPYEGSFCMRSKTNLGDSQESRITFNHTSQADDSIIFYYKVSSEENYDFFKFYIDGSSKLQVSGTCDWTRAAFAVPAGSHIFSFGYNKDYSRGRGSDCAWVDNISLPFAGDICNYVEDTVCQGEPYTFCNQELSTAEQGLFLYSDTANANPVTIHFLALHVMGEPNVGIEVVGNPVAGQCVLLKAYGADSYLWNTGDSTECIAVCLSDSVVYTVTGSRGGCSAEARVGFLGIEDAEAARVALYPNPAQSSVTVEADQMRAVEVVNLMGQTLGRIRVDGNRTVIDLQKLPNGIYFIRIETPESTVVKKLIKK